VTPLAVLAQTSVKLFQLVAGATYVRYGDMTGGGRVGLISENRAARLHSRRRWATRIVFAKFLAPPRFCPECGTGQWVSNRNEARTRVRVPGDPPVCSLWTSGGVPPRRAGSVR